MLKYEKEIRFLIKSLRNSDSRVDMECQPPNNEMFKLPDKQHGLKTV